MSICKKYEESWYEESGWDNLIKNEGGYFCRKGDVSEEDSSEWKWDQETVVEFLRWRCYSCEDWERRVWADCSLWQECIGTVRGCGSDDPRQWNDIAEF